MSKPGQPSFKFNRAARRSIYETGQKKGIASPARQPTVACRRRNHVLDLPPLHKFRPINSARVAEMDCGLAQRLQAVPVVSNLFPKQTLLQRSTMFFFQAEDGIRDYKVNGVQTCALPI